MEAAGVGQAELAERLGMHESSISRMIRGQTQGVTVDQLVRIERALDLRPGRVLRTAGLVDADDGATVRERIETDPLLTASERTIVLRIYDGSVAASREDRKRSSVNSEPAARRSRRT